MTAISRRVFLKWVGASGALSLIPLAATAAPPEGKGNKTKKKDHPHGNGSDDLSKLVSAGISVAAARDLYPAPYRRGPASVTSCAGLDPAKIKRPSGH